MRSTATIGNHCVGDLASGNSAGSHPSNMFPQKVGSSLQLSHYEPIRRTIQDARFKLDIRVRPFLSTQTNR
jgi:hypothetical protein